MTVDGSYMAWVRPTRRVHLALSAGMTLTGVVLIAAGAAGGHRAVRPSPAIGRAADSVVGVVGLVGAGNNGTELNGVPGGLVPAAPLVHVAPPVTTSPVTTPPVVTPPVTAPPKPDAKPHAKPKPHHRRPAHPAHPSAVSRPMPPASPASQPPHPSKR